MAKAKKAKKAEKKAPNKDKDKKKRVTITSLVLAFLDKKPDAETKEIYDHLVANGFPGTKFKKSHLAWYKYKIRKGDLKLPSGKTLPPGKRGRKKAGKENEEKTGKKADKKKTGKKAKK